MANVGIRVLTDHDAYPVSQYRGYDFNSMCVAPDGTVIATGDDGIYTLFDSETQNGSDIESRIKSHLTDFGIPNQKRIRTFYVGYETSGELKMTVSDEEENERLFYLKPIKNKLLQHTGKVPVGRDGKGRYWSVLIENEDGCDFSVDSVDATLIVGGNKPPGSGF